MSERDKNLVGTQPPPESQKERWVKYGANVVLSSVVVILLALLLTYLAQAHARRIDTTIGGSQSLRPQTVDFIRNLKTKVKLVGLYPRLKSDSHGEQDYYQPVADLLTDYAGRGQNVTVELINPDLDKDRLTKLIAEVTNKYGGESKEYKALLADLPDKSAQLQKYASAEDKLMSALPDVQDENLQQKLLVARLTLRGMDHQLTELKDSIDADLSSQIPSYKDAVDAVRAVYSQANQGMALLSAVLESFKADPAVPQAMKDYAPGALARQAEASKVAAAVLDRINHLGELKELDEFRRQLTSKSILVMTDAGYKILQFGDVWKVPEQSRILGGTDVQPRLTFAGEQQITAAIGSLASGKKQMVVFVRPQGPPLTVSNSPDQDAPLGALADRLREYNFDVQEKDASGRPNNQEMPTPEPSEEQMKSAIWIIIRLPGDSTMGPSPISAMVDAHLKSGGSALILLMPTDDPMADVLGAWGIQARTDFAFVHEAPSAPARRSADPLDSILQTNQVVFMLNQYGDHPLANPLQGLGFLTYNTCPITAMSNPPPFVKVTPLLPIPLIPHAWATSNAESVVHPRSAKYVFNPKSDPEAGHPTPDLDNKSDGRLYAAAAAEKSTGGRLVVVGGIYFVTSDLLTLREADRPDVARLPGNGEFVTDSVLWLAHQDQMLAISPHALEVARIEEMSPAKLNFWRYGILSVGLPAAVVLAGLMVYMRRRD